MDKEPKINDNDADLLREYIKKFGYFTESDEIEHLLKTNQSNPNEQWISFFESETQFESPCKLFLLKLLMDVHQKIVDDLSSVSEIEKSTEAEIL